MSISPTGRLERTWVSLPMPPSGAVPGGRCRLDSRCQWALRQLGQIAISRLRHLGQELERIVGCFFDQLVKSVFVQLAKFGGDPFKALQPLEIAAARRSPLLVGEGLPSLVASQHPLVGGSATGRWL
ncbi:MAG: hypothetical protein R2706_18385 [Acidimicrobiales bacterium]